MAGTLGTFGQLKRLAELFGFGGGSSKPVYAPAYLQPWGTGTLPSFTTLLEGPGTFQGTISGNVLTVTSITTGGVSAGAIVTGTSVTANSIVQPYGTGGTTGTGGTGTYQLSQTSTVGTAEAMVATAGSSIAGATFYPWYQPNCFTYFGGASSGADGLGHAYSYNLTEPSAADQYLPQFIETTFTGTSFEVAQEIIPGNNPGGMVIFIGQWNGTTPPTQGIKLTKYAMPSSLGTNNAGDIFLRKITLPAGTYTVTVYASMGFVGLYTAGTISASTRQRNGNVLGVFGDSYIGGFNPGTGGSVVIGDVCDNYPLELMLQTNHDEVILFGEPGTGWMNDGSNTQLFTAARTPYYSARRLASLIGNRCTTIHIAGSGNDIVISGYDTQSNTHVTQFLNALCEQVGQYTRIFVAGGQRWNLNSTPQWTPIDTQIAAGIANVTNPRNIEINQIICTSDGTTSGTPWINGTGTTAVPAGDGNADTYCQADHKHDNQQAHFDIWAPKFAANINAH
jgi:hypothetical protein